MVNGGLILSKSKTYFENIAGKGEKLVTSFFSFSYNIFYPFKNKLQFFSNIYFANFKSFSLNQSKNILFNKIVLPFPKQALVFTCLQYKSFENTLVKGEIAYNKQYLLFPQCFQPVSRSFCHFHQIYNCRLQTLSVQKSLKFFVWERVKEKRWIKHSFAITEFQTVLVCLISAEIILLIDINGFLE